MSRRDPSGYYVIVAVDHDETREILSEFTRREKLLVERAGNVAIIRCRSRKTAEELARALVLRGLLVS